MKLFALFLVTIIGAVFLYNSPKSNVLSISANSDTINIAYTYWWPSGGPFTGLCGNKYSLMFTGTITKLNSPEKSYPNGRNVGDVIWTPQKGVIKINKMEFENPPEEGYKKTAGRIYKAERVQSVR